MHDTLNKIQFNVMNISARFDLGTRVDLIKAYQALTTHTKYYTSYEPERLQALVIRTPDGTILLYPTGKGVVLGMKNPLPPPALEEIKKMITNAKT